jgi:alpha-beta hydrolase superfamily lysophospholipase
MSASEPYVTYLELRQSGADGEAGSGLSHSSEGLVLLHVLELAADGEPRGAVTIVHDAGEHGGRFLELARVLAAEGWAIALPDLRGHGRSEGERGHSAGVKEVLRDLGDVQDHLAYRQPDAPKVLVGQGLGALWCLAYASERPDGIAALVLVAPLLEPRFALPQKAGGWKGLFQKVGPTSAGRIGWSPADLSRDAEALRRRASDEHVHDVITLRAGEQALEAAQRHAPRIATLPMPVLVLQGDADRIGSPAKVAGEIGPKVEVASFAGAKHDLLHETCARDVEQTIAGWLGRKLPR